MKGYDLKPDPYAKKSFWLTWPGVILGSLGIVLGGVVFFNGDTIAANHRSEFQEIRELLLKGDYLKERYALVSDIEAEAHRQKRSPALWKIEHHGQKSFGFFTVEIEGWIKLSDRRPDRSQAKVFFEKTDDLPLVITKIDGIFVHYKKGEKD